MLVNVDARGVRSVFSSGSRRDLARFLAAVGPVFALCGSVGCNDDEAAPSTRSAKPPNTTTKSQGEPEAKPSKLTPMSLADKGWNLVIDLPVGTNVRATNAHDANPVVSFSLGNASMSIELAPGAAEQQTPAGYATLMTGDREDMDGLTAETYHRDERGWIQVWRTSAGKASKLVAMRSDPGVVCIAEGGANALVIEIVAAACSSISHAPRGDGKMASLAELQGELQRQIDAARGPADKATRDFQKFKPSGAP
ncbi:MAG: hypothetical protein GY811_07375 [Myxococcales bacterium]|nr:hypothetical protein [Myxococcales bacterium]